MVLTESIRGDDPVKQDGFVDQSLIDLMSCMSGIHTERVSAMHGD